MCFTLRTNEISVIVWDTDTQTFVRQRIVTFTSPYPQSSPTRTASALPTSRESVPDRVRRPRVRHPLQPLQPLPLHPVGPALLLQYLAASSWPLRRHPENTTYEYPDCHFPITGQDYEETRITLVEKFAGTAAYKRPLTCHVVQRYAPSPTPPSPSPGPSSTPSPIYGLRMATSSQILVASRPDGLWRAPRTPLAAIDITGDIVSLTSASPRRGQRRARLGSRHPGHRPWTTPRGQYANPGAGGRGARFASLSRRAGAQAWLRQHRRRRGRHRRHVLARLWQYTHSSIAGEGRSNQHLYPLLPGRLVPGQPLDAEVSAPLESCRDATPHNVWTSSLCC
jgi:hypothetical protein